ncbi:hypothetical protein [Brassicibacter mesophilus]|uniref:hypothetical protein n=1 Tax=Brassicibacter mesophilus TaxID=745119 RepID=UPI003D1E2753
MHKFLKNLLVIAIVSLILQAAWEYWQCSIYYTMADLTNHTRLMTSATLGDIMMTIVLYGLLVLVNHDVNWIIRRWNLKEYVIMALYALFLSFYFEISALHSSRWGYNELMPLFPTTNIALIPVIQLLILFPVSFYISRLILERTAKNYNT